MLSFSRQVIMGTVSILLTGGLLADTPVTRPSSRPAAARPATLPVMAADTLIRYGLDNGFLIIQTTLPPTTSPIRCQVPNLPGELSLTIRHPRPQPTWYTPNALQLLYKEQNVLGQTTQIFLGTSGGQLTLSRGVEIGEFGEDAQYLQSPLGILSGTPVRLYLQGMTPGGQAYKKDFTAESFIAFIRQYPRETTQYLRPIIEAFAPQPQLFQVDDKLGCFVFPEAYQPDLDVRQQILQLVQKLDADDFRQREEATAQLQKMGAPALVILQNLDRKQLTAEQSSRLDTVLSQIKPPYACNPTLLRSENGFLLDCLLSANPLLRKAALHQLQQNTGRQIQFPETPDLQLQTQAVYQLRQQILSAPTSRPAN